MLERKGWRETNVSGAEDTVAVINKLSYRRIRYSLCLRYNETHHSHKYNRVFRNSFCQSTAIIKCLGFYYGGNNSTYLYGNLSVYSIITIDT